MATKRRNPMQDYRPFREEIMAKVELCSEINLVTGCWEWTAGMNQLLYAQMYFKGYKGAASRLIYNCIHGPFDVNLDACHSCDNPMCVNPEHIRVDTHKNNLADASRRKRLNGQWKVNCKRGHPLSGENLYVGKDGFRKCKRCHMDAQLRRWHSPDGRVKARQKAYRQRKRMEQKQQGATP